MSWGYTFGFNGKEMDNEVSGQGNQYDYGFRIYNPRLGKFLSVDPLTKSYPWYTPYQFAGNTPIQAIDLDGLEELKVYDPQTNYVLQVILVDEEGNRYEGENAIKSSYRVNRKQNGRWTSLVDQERILLTSGKTVLQKGDPRHGAKVITYIVNATLHQNGRHYSKLRQEGGTLEREPQGITSLKTPVLVNPTSLDLALATSPPWVDRIYPPIIEDDDGGKGGTHPPSIDPPTLSGINFTPGGYVKTDRYSSSVQRTAQWLIENPDYTIDVISDAVGTSGGVGATGWDQIIPGSERRNFWGRVIGGTTYGQRLDQLLNDYKEDIIRAGEGKIDGGRINPRRGKLNDNKVKTEMNKTSG